MDLDPFRISQVGIVKFFASELQADTLPTAVDLESYRISQVGIVKFFASELQADTLPTASLQPDPTTDLSSF